jgi:polyhydroxyalkanoic acid synthase PhaR subunit
MLSEMMSTDQFSQGMGQFMNVYLTMQRNMNDAVERYLAGLNVPTRSDVVDLAARVATLEHRLSELESGAKSSGRSASPRARPRPPRTKQPPSRQATTKGRKK